MGMTAETMPRISTVRKAVLPLFLVSGATGLIYEITWTRVFGVVFGNTVFAVSTVLTGFMLGLALGSWLLGRIADKSSHPLKLYAFLELGIGAYALLFPTIIAGTDVFYRWFFRSFHPTFYPMSLARFVLSIAILILPTALMGGTLPVLSKLWANPSRKKSSEPRVGQSVGLLYAINTFGAVTGSFLAGYILMRVLGVRNTIYLAASANVVVGALAFIVSRYSGHRQVAMAPGASTAKRALREGRHSRKSRRASEVPKELKKKRLIVLAAVGLAGSCALALEVLWTRVLVFVLETTVYAFASMLTCFLLGIALGSFLCSRLLVGKMKNPVLALGVVEFLVALSVLASVPVLGKLWHIDYVLTWKLRASGFWKEVMAHFVDASVVVLIPTMLMGAAFPIAVKACTQSWKAVGRRVGEVYAFNTLGCVIGSFAAGFVMVPLLGLRDSFLVVAGIQLFLGVALFFFSERRRAVLGAPAAVVSLVLIVIAVLGIPRDVFLRTMNTYHYPSKIVYIKDDATGTVTVHDLAEGERLIAVDGVDVAGMSLMLRTTQKLQGYVPLLIHDNPQKVVQIGFGSGETSGVGLGFGVAEYSIVEICTGVFEAGRFFDKINRSSYRDPRLRKIIMDGKNFVKLTDEKFDVIMNDSTYPGTTGSSALYTYDHFKQCRERLNPGGVQSCWVPLDLRPEDFRIIVRSFQKVMPHSSLWMANNCLNKHAVLVGTVSPLEVDFQRVKKLVERPDLASDLAIINIHSVYDLLDCFVVDEERLRKMAGAGPLNTDDRPSLEFGAAIKRDLHKCFMTVLGELSQNHSPVLPHVVNLGDTQEKSQQVKATLEQYFTGTSHALRGLLAIRQGDAEIMNQEFEMARKANPQDRDVESCLEELRAEIKKLVGAVERMPRSASLRSRLAKRYLLLQDYEHAAEEYLKFLKLEPRDALAAWNNLGVCYKEMKDFDKAVSALKKALELDPLLVSAYFNLGEVYGRLRNFTASSQNYERALSLNPRSRRIYIGAADTYYNLGRAADSARVLKRCLSTWPDFVLGYVKLARAYFEQKEYGLALDAVEKALELAPDNAFLQDRRNDIIRAAEGVAP